MLLRLVHAAADTGQTRRRAIVDQLRRQVPDPQVNRVLGEFVRARLLNRVLSVAFDTDGRTPAAGNTSGTFYL
ncbi:hypothetical protein EV192_108381 [Actinocrispum wychmicini]|uniref:Uncharacterized protein n=1 Tax=Actinocrispum wychmicini TaxID=1213861 RepID=A0A4R2J7J7_9PSEU|nr:hypothetical protein EV192_108381 [Actinocrispum wychmicini]